MQNPHGALVVVQVLRRQVQGLGDAQLGPPEQDDEGLVADARGRPPAAGTDQRHRLGLAEHLDRVLEALVGRLEARLGRVGGRVGAAPGGGLPLRLPFPGHGLYQPVSVVGDFCMVPCHAAR